jgi:hypothetical protein
MTDDTPRAATRDRLGEYDAIETAKPGEPLFPIQGGDPFGPATVQFWVDLCRKAGMAEPDRKKAEALLRTGNHTGSRGAAAAVVPQGPGLFGLGR